MWNFRHFVFHLAARVVAAILCDSSQLFPPDGSKLDVCYTKLSLFELLPVKVKLFLSYQRVDFCLESFGSMEGTLFFFFFCLEIQDHFVPYFACTIYIVWLFYPMSNLFATVYLLCCYQKSHLCHDVVNIP